MILRQEFERKRLQPSQRQDGVLSSGLSPPLLWHVPKKPTLSPHSNRNPDSADCSWVSMKMNGVLLKMETGHSNQLSPPATLKVKQVLHQIHGLWLPHWRLWTYFLQHSEHVASVLHYSLNFLISTGHETVTHNSKSLTSRIVLGSSAGGLRITAVTSQPLGTELPTSLL